MINIVIPMAGAGSRFSKAGYKDPKPLIKIVDVPMIQLVVANLTPSKEHRFIFICQQSHIDIYGLVEKLHRFAPNSEVIGLDGLTDGAACTVLMAEKFIDNDDELMIANSDQYVEVDIDRYLEKIENEKLDGLIMTMKANDPKWSFAGLDDSKTYVTHVVEKEVISDEATVGIYNFSKGREFVSAAKDMIAKNLRVNNEFYVAPVYNQLIENKKKIGIYNIGKERDGMYGLGIPADLDYFLTHPVLERALLDANRLMRP